MVRKIEIARLNAFTVFELTVVIAIMSTLIAIIMFAYQRFNEQLKISTEISNNLNEWHLIRANLWRDLLESDSLKIESKKVQLYKNNNLVVYRSEDDKLIRENEAGSQVLNIGVEKISEVIKNNKSEIVFTFMLNDETTFDLKYTSKTTTKKTIDSYFKNLSDGKSIE